MADIETLVKSSLIGSELCAPEQLRGECEHFLLEVKRRLHDLELNVFGIEKVASFTTITNHLANGLDVEVWSAHVQDDAVSRDIPLRAVGKFGFREERQR